MRSMRKLAAAHAFMARMKQAEAQNIPRSAPGGSVCCSLAGAPSATAATAAADTRAAAASPTRDNGTASAQARRLRRSVTAALSHVANSRPALSQASVWGDLLPLRFRWPQYTQQQPVHCSREPLPRMGRPQ